MSPTDDGLTVCFEMSFIKRKDTSKLPNKKNAGYGSINSLLKNEVVLTV